MITYYDELYHHGVKGMKWGVRHDPEPSGHRSSHSTPKDKVAKGKESVAMRGLKYAAIVAGVGLAAYAATKYGRIYMDSTLKAGDVLKVVSKGEKDISKAFYGTRNMGDAERYKGFYGMQLAKNPFMPGKVLQQDIKYMGENAKIAGKRSSQKIFDNLYKNDEAFRSHVDSITPNWNGTSAYDRFNQALVDHSPTQQKFTDQFYNELKKNGYSGIKDINDRVYSGYKAKDANIYFNNLDKFNITESREVSNIKDVYEKEMGRLLKEDRIELAGLTSASMIISMYGSHTFNNKVEELSKKKKNR